MMNRQGFTLIELMIVVVIIGLLAAIAIPQYANLQNHAREASTKSNAHTVQMALEDYSVQNDGIYSVVGADITPLLPGQALLENVYTGMASEPQFGAAAAQIGQIGAVGVVQGGIPIGYTITVFGTTQIVLTLGTL